LILSTQPTGYASAGRRAGEKSTTGVPEGDEQAEPATIIRPGPPGIMSIEFRVINMATNGPVVMTERVDVFKLPHKSFELPVMGTFEVSDGKINAWRDYFDLNQFNSQMG
jgi:limonene-1,2-epoxide hydrolase